MQLIAATLHTYKRLPTRAVKVGDLIIGDFNPIRLQTMTTTDTMDTKATVEEAIRCIEAGAELIRITAPSKKEAENLLHIKNELRRQGYHTPLVADIHFTPNAAEIAARLIEKVRVNPGNYVDKKKFEQIDYTNAAYEAEIEKIQEKFTPLIKICKEYGTAMRIGTNHGSLSDRIMSRYGDTPMGMVESAMEFLRIARYENYHNIVLSMKASNPQVMVEAYRLLVASMQEEFQECYPLHLGVTEAGDGEDGRVKSAVGMGTLLEDGIGDTVRVSLTEAPEAEIPVCKDLVKRYPLATSRHEEKTLETMTLQSRETHAVAQIGGGQVPVVIADVCHIDDITAARLDSVGYHYEAALDKWQIADTACDFLFSNKPIEFPLPGTLQVIVPAAIWNNDQRLEKHFPLWKMEEFLSTSIKHEKLNFIQISTEDLGQLQSSISKLDNTSVLCISSSASNTMQDIRAFYQALQQSGIHMPTIIQINSQWHSADEHLIHYATEAGALLLDHMGEGLWLSMQQEAYVGFTNAAKQDAALSGRQYNDNDTAEQFMNTTTFSILQAARKRITKTEYISCPSCGRTLFDLQETTAMIRKRTDHLKGVKIAIMGCIVNGPGEMADADFGYVGSGVGKITLYKGKEVVKRNVPSEIAVDELINLLKENDAWVEQ